MREEREALVCVLPRRAPPLALEVEGEIYISLDSVAAAAVKVSKQKRRTILL